VVRTNGIERGKALRLKAVRETEAGRPGIGPRSVCALEDRRRGDRLVPESVGPRMIVERVGGMNGLWTCG
jgi:hypothetical protein